MYAFKQWVKVIFMKPKPMKPERLELMEAKATYEFAVEQLAAARARRDRAIYKAVEAGETWETCSRLAGVTQATVSAALDRVRADFGEK